MNNGGRDRISTSVSALGLSKLERFRSCKPEDTVAIKVMHVDDPNGRNGQRTFRCLSAGISFRWRCNSSILNQVKPPTGEPYAGDPPVRFGGRGSSLLSLPLSTFVGRLPHPANSLPGKTACMGYHPVGEKSGLKRQGVSLDVVLNHGLLDTNVVELLGVL